MRICPRSLKRKNTSSINDVTESYEDVGHGGHYGVDDYVGSNPRLKATKATLIVTKERVNPKDIEATTTTTMFKESASVAPQSSEPKTTEIKLITTLMTSVMTIVAEISL